MERSKKEKKRKHNRTRGENVMCKEVKKERKERERKKIKGEVKGEYKKL